MMTASDFTPRLSSLSNQLVAAGVDLYLQPVGDEFQGEYVPAYAARLAYLCGFTGSAGLGAFWAKPGDARVHALFTDGRYTLQAAQELAGTGVVPHNSGEQPLAAWVRLHAAAALTIGFDPWLISHAQLEAWRHATRDLPVRWQALAENPVDAGWRAQPATPAGAVRLHPETISGMGYAQKRAALLEKIAVAKADAAIFALPDGINWLLNLRGDDIPFNPLLLAYAVLHRDGALALFTFDRAFDPAVMAYLQQNEITLHSLADCWRFAQSPFGAGKRVLVDPASAAQGWWQWAEQAGVELLAGDDLTLLPKACKNPVELEGMRAAHRRDGVALSRFLCWFDAQAESKRLPDELGAIAQLEAFRAKDNRYRGASFATIAGAGPHGAIVHYRASEASNRRVQKGELFLLDSGGQYDDGTTDVTRTMPTGVLTTAMQEHYTRVLKGHIALARAVFPVGTAGVQLDALARLPLWEAGLDYDHGTGHGVGAYLCVHEGPQRISKKGSAVALKPGMVLSNEPGYYAAGSHGIRIENLVTVIEQAPGWLAFETLTLAPIDTRPVLVELLSTQERNWLNSYHQRVYNTLEQALDSPERAWLQQATRAI
jgi:Xaa-Pro aminopeptidase